MGISIVYRITHMEAYRVCSEDAFGEVAADSAQLTLRRVAQQR